MHNYIKKGELIMQNVKKSLIFVTALVSVQQSLPTILGQTTDSRTPSYIMNITGSGPYKDQIGTYNAHTKEAVLGKDGEHIFTQVVPVSQAIRYDLPKHAVRFATMPNPKWSGKSMPGGQQEHIKLWGVLSTKVASSSEEPTHKKSSKHFLGTNGAGQYRGITIYGFGSDEKGSYDHKNKTARINNVSYRVEGEFTPLHEGTMVPQKLGGARLFGYIDNSSAKTKKMATKSTGGMSTKTYLYGIALESDIA